MQPCLKRINSHSINYSRRPTDLVEVLSHRIRRGTARYGTAIAASTLEFSICTAATRGAATHHSVPCRIRYETSFTYPGGSRYMNGVIAVFVNMYVCLYVCLSVCPRYKRKTARAISISAPNSAYINRRIKRSKFKVMRLSNALSAWVGLCMSTFTYVNC